MSGNTPNYGPTGNAAGGFFDPAEMGPLEAVDPSDNNNYDPNAVQQMILTFIAEHKKGMTEFQTEYLMWLMQEYGNQKIGLGAQTQTRMNGYFADIQGIWDTVNAAEAGKGGENYTQEFDTKVQNLINKIKADPYFKAHSDMLNQVVDNLENLQKGVDTKDPRNTKGVDNLVWMWQVYNGKAETPQNDKVNVDPDATAMGNLMRGLGETNQQFTGVSQSVGVGLQSETKNQQSEMDALNNFLKMLQSLVKGFVRGQTAGMA